ncbi:MAG TPA: NeuD/PglB/VioB family sugar acetyltransferase [Sphingomonas sp.]|jgi:sugar O-acyltransferase (sialic acid O-acetyltransferase NeuD family)|uniref:NeuD/PglB/VioB family sugar acetyltransferase n=1 Tax=Sphingomonas sp. TaxID=28214 RepID=UPI002EDA4C09
MSERIIIVGGGGFGRELVSHVGDAHRAGMLPGLGGYLDDAGDVLAAFGHYAHVPWLGRLDDYRPEPGDLFTLAVGAPRTKKALAERLRTRGARFATVIHPSAVTSPTAKLGEGVIVGTHAGPGVDTVLGDFVTLNSYSGIGHDAAVGDFTTISGHVDITGGTQIGEGVFIGSNSSILPRVRIGDWANVGAGSIVYRTIKSGQTVYAPPAKLLKKG